MSYRVFARIGSVLLGSAHGVRLHPIAAGLFAGAPLATARRLSKVSVSYPVEAGSHQLRRFHRADGRSRFRRSAGACGAIWMRSTSRKGR